MRSVLAEFPDGDDAYEDDIIMEEAEKFFERGDLENEGDDKPVTEAKKMEVKNEEEETRRLQDLVESHPVLRQLPDHLKKGVVETPAVDLKMIPGCNRRKRKVMAGGFVIYTY